MLLMSTGEKIVGHLKCDAHRWALALPVGLNGDFGTSRFKAVLETDYIICVRVRKKNVRFASKADGTTTSSARASSDDGNSSPSRRAV